MRTSHLYRIAFIVLSRSCTAQEVFLPAESRNNTFNATYGALDSASAAALIATANLSDAQSAAVLVAVEFERSNWAGSSTQQDPFYQDLPAESSQLAPGEPLKIEQYTNTSLYTLPPNVALSRFLFVTKTLNGTSVHASAFVLWPWSARRFPGVEGAPVVGWAHGTSGWSGECAPSHVRNLWYQYSALFTLALQGYAVVAPDYAGLGVDRDAEGGFIAHQYAANPAAASDLIYAVQAAQKAWPRLSREFVLMGHSQGGGAAWAAAEALAKEPVDGYLGTVAASPLTSIAKAVNSVLDNPLILGSFFTKFVPTIASIFPAFEFSEWLSDKGVRVAEVIQSLQGCQSVGAELTGVDFLREGWNDTWYLEAFDNLAKVGGKDFAGPMLVLQGTEDLATPLAFTSEAVNETCSAYTQSSLQLTLLEGVTHVPTLYAGQQVWLDWISDRFSGVSLQPGCSQEALKPLLEPQAYQKELALVLQYPLFFYETF